MFVLGGMPQETSVQSLLDAVVQFLTDLTPESTLKDIAVINEEAEVASLVASAFEQVCG